MDGLSVDDGDGLVREAKSLLAKSIAASKFCEIGERYGPTKLQVYDASRNSRSYMVNLTEKTCQCTLWQRNQIPCKHAARALAAARIQAQKVVHPSWHLKELRGVFERGKSQLFLPDWKVIHDMASTEGNHGLRKLSDEGIQRVYAQLRRVGGDAGRWTSLESFSEWWSRRQKIPKLILQVRAQILRATSPTRNSKCELRGARARRRGGRRALMVLQEDQRRLLESHLLWMDIVLPSIDACK